MAVTVPSANSAVVLEEQVRELQSTIEEMQKDPGIISKYLEELKGRALSLGIRVLLVVVVFFVCSKLITLLRRLIKKGLEHYGAGENAINFLDLVIKWVLYVVLILALAVNLGVDASSIVAIIGSLGVTIGLALQGSLSNFAGGVLLLVMKPFVAGEYILDLNTGVTGTVQEVHIFYTKLLTDNRYVAMIPNGNLSNNTIINYSRRRGRQVIASFPISYTSDVEKAREVLLRIVSEEPSLMKDPPAEPGVYLKSFDESSVTLELRCFLENDRYLDHSKAVWRMNEKAKAAFEENGIQIPYKQVDVHLSGEALQSLTNTKDR